MITYITFMDSKMKSIQLRLYEARAGIENQIDEDLTPKQKKEVDSYGDGSAATRISSHVFPEGQDRITVPLSHQDVPPHPNVKDHLEKHGYKITNYMDGKAEDRHGRETNIGKALTKTKAHPDVMHSFVNDPNRQSSQSSKPLKVIISKHPHDVAGMSTDRHWSSCMTMGGTQATSGKEEDNGQYADKLEDDIKHGTHVAYLVHHDDDGIHHPVARIALKPHHAYTGGHTILRPEGKAYGNSNHAFEKTVKDFAEKNYPMKKENMWYDKNEHVYNDDGKYTEHNKDTTTDDIHHALDSDHNHVRQAAIEHPNATSEHIHKALNDRSSSVRRSAIYHPNVTSEHIDKALNDPDDAVRAGAAKNNNASSEQLHKALKDDDGFVRRTAMRNKNATSTHIDRGIKDEDESVRRAAIIHPNATSKHVDKALNNIHDKDLRETALRGDKVSSENLHKALNDKDEGVRRAAMMHRKINSEHIDHALDDKSPKIRVLATIRHEASDENIHKALDDKEEAVRLSAIRNKNASPKNIHKALDDKEEDVRWSAAGHDNATPENLDKALDDDSENVKITALHHRNASAHHIKKALNDKNPYVRERAVALNSRLSEEYVPTKKQYNKISLNKFRAKIK